jgi:hypothetical protein
MKMKSTFFCDVMRYILVEVYRRFGWTYCLHLQDRWVSRVNNIQAGSSVKSSFIRCLLPHISLDSENGGCMFIRNAGKFLPNWKVSLFRIHCSSKTFYLILFLVSFQNTPIFVNIITTFLMACFYKKHHEEHEVIRTTIGKDSKD